MLRKYDFLPIYLGCCWTLFFKGKLFSGKALNNANILQNLAGNSETDMTFTLRLPQGNAELLN